MWPRVSYEVAVKVAAGAAVIGGSTGAGILFQRGSHTWLLAGGLSLICSPLLMTRQLASPRTSGPRNNKRASRRLQTPKRNTITPALFS